MHKSSFGERLGLSQEKDGKLFQNVEIVYAKAKDKRGVVCSRYYKYSNLTFGKRRRGRKRSWRGGLRHQHEGH